MLPIFLWLQAVPCIASNLRAAGREPPLDDRPPASNRFSWNSSLGQCYLNIEIEDPAYLLQRSNWPLNVAISL